MRVRWLVVCCLSLLAAGLTTPTVEATAATTPPSGFAATVLASTGIYAPTLMAFSPEGNIVIAQQNGKVKIAVKGVVSATPYLTLTTESSTDRGVLGITFDPAYSTNHYVYVYYHRPAPTIHGVISRFTANPGGLSADPASEVVLYSMDSLEKTGLHTGGSLGFGPDGKLYVSVGDDARGVEVSHSLTSDLGKLLRLNPDGTIPSDNPFLDQTTGKYGSIYSRGHRNPYTWTFDSRGHLLLAEVGLSSFEEINDVVGGADYGWPTYEGPDGGDPAYADPVSWYPHGSTPETGCAIIGAAAVDPATSRLPDTYDGDFFFADYCAGTMRAFDPATGQVSTFATGIVSPTHVVFGPDGNLYYLSRNTTGGSGWITRISYTGSTAPTISRDPASVTVGVGDTATFTVEADGAAPLSYQWYRDGTAVPGATDPTYSLAGAQLADSGAAFTVRVSNSQGTVESSPAVLTVGENQAPVPQISAPLNGAKYQAGQVVRYAGTATDKEDGKLPASAYDWEVEFHHDTHVHPFLDPAPGTTSGSFTVPDSGFETATNVWFRVTLTVTDSGGRSTSVHRDVYPRTTGMALAVSPADAKLALDGSVVSPATVPTVVNMQRTLGVPSPQTLTGGSWVFDSWSDRGSAQHVVRPTATDNWFMAVLRLDAGSTGTGTGLTGSYFDDPDLTSKVLERTDPVALLQVPSAKGPAPGVAPGTWSVRWEGTVQPQFSQATTFRVLADDGVRLWVNGNLVINAWGPAPAATLSSPALTMTAGSRVPIRLEVRQGSGRVGKARLLWQSKSMPRSVVPSSQLYPLR